ncbi:MAG: tetratricopeptide repeat protein, partial [Candidatus Aenigmatarchaeota archaeon]
MALAQFRYGRYKQAREYIERLEAIRPLKLEEVILYSDIFLSERKQKEAYEVLKKYFEKIESDKEDLYILYLRKFSALAWINQDIETSAKASEVLHKMGKASKDDYIRLYTYYALKKNYTKAIEYASIGYRKSRDEYLFTLWVESLSALGDWKGIVDAYREYDREKLLANSYLTAIYTRALYMLGRRQEARQIILRSLKANSSLSSLSNAIYTAVGFYDKELIDYLIRNFSPEEKMLPREFAILYMAKQEGYKAKRLLDQIKEKDKEEILLYSYALNLMGRTEEAIMIRHTLVRDVLKDGKVSKDPNELRITLMSGVGILPSYYMQDLLAKAREDLRPEIWLNIYLSHLFVNNFYEEIEYMKNIKKAKLEPWMELSLALRNNDRERINQILEEMADMLPYRDVAESYRILGHYRKAVERAQQNLEKNPEDALAYEQLRQLVDAYVSQIRIGVSQRNVDKTGYLLYNLHLMYALTDKWYIILGREGGFLLYNNNSALANLPSSFSYNNLAVRFNVNNGYYELGTAFGEGIKDFAGIEIKASKRIFTIDNITTSVYYNKPVKETLIMNLSAVKDGFSISATKSLFPRIGIGSTFEYNTFKSQDMKKIGQGFNLYLETFYKLKVTYPDYTFRFYTAFADYEEKNNKSNRLLRLYSFGNP